jgi:hypothetical protein
MIPSMRFKNKPRPPSFRGARKEVRNVCPSGIETAKEDRTAEEEDIGVQGCDGGFLDYG